MGAVWPLWLGPEGVTRPFIRTATILLLRLAVGFAGASCSRLIRVAEMVPGINNIMKKLIIKITTVELKAAM